MVLIIEINENGKINPLMNMAEQLLQKMYIEVGGKRIEK